MPSASGTPATNATAGCLFRKGHRYEDARLRGAAARHNCRYFSPAPMRAMCDALSRGDDKPEWFVRGKNYAEQYFPWWCKADWEAEAKVEEAP